MEVNPRLRPRPIPLHRVIQNRALPSPKPLLARMPSRPRRRQVMPKDALTITDQRTDKTYELPIEHETIRAMDLRKIKVKPDDFGLMTYDPAFMNTANCKSTITFIDGDKGILRYRGYDIDDLAENCTFLQVAYLLLHGELPN